MKDWMVFWLKELWASRKQVAGVVSGLCFTSVALIVGAAFYRDFGFWPTITAGMLTLGVAALLFKVNQ